MRNYSQKMAAYRLPKDRYESLRAFCLSADWEQTQLIKEIAIETVPDALSEWIVMYARKGMTWTQLEARGVPCSRDTFRYYRARFFWLLDKHMYEASLTVEDNDRIEV